MKRILILGGGFGGLATAHKLRQLRPQDEIVVVDQASHFMVGFRKTWKLLGQFDDEIGQGNLADLEQFGIQYVQGTVTEIDPGQHAAVVEGRRLEGDALVVALGARLATELVPGFDEHVLNLYDPHSLSAIRDKLKAFKGGRVGIGVFGLPYKCPPAPYEIALLLSTFFKDRGVEVELEVFTPQPMSLPILGTAGCNVIEDRLAGKGITFLPGRQAAAATGSGVVFAQDRRRYDLLLGVAPHRAPGIVAKAGLVDASGWVKVDPQTMQTDFADVYAIGDIVKIMMANGKPLPKAGVFAEAEGQVVAERVAATFEGQTPQAEFDGRGGCFLEVDDGLAMMVEGEFLAQPAPQVRLAEASTDLFARKRAFEADRLSAWFTAAG